MLYFHIVHLAGQHVVFNESYLRNTKEMLLVYISIKVKWPKTNSLIYLGKLIITTQVILDSLCHVGLNNKDSKNEARKNLKICAHL